MSTTVMTLHLAGLQLAQAELSAAGYQPDDAPLRILSNLIGKALAAPLPGWCGPLASKCYPDLALAHAQMVEAQRHFQAVMAREFPRGTPVRVNHYRGSYTGTVAWAGGHADDSRIEVRNDATGKMTGRYPLHDCEGQPEVEKLADGGEG